jgi:hypothetical protein
VERQNARVRTLVIVPGDQLDRSSAALDGFDPGQDAIWMAEVLEESTLLCAAKQRTQNVRSRIARIPSPWERSCRSTSTAAGSSSRYVYRACSARRK